MLKATEDRSANSGHFGAEMTERVETCGGRGGRGGSASSPSQTRESHAIPTRLPRDPRASCARGAVASRAFHRSSPDLLPVRVHAPVLALNSEPSSFLYLHDIRTATASLIRKTDTTVTLETINLVVSARTQSH